MKKILACIGIGIAFYSCADFIEYPLEKESVNLLAPAAGLVTKDSVHTFWWDTHQDAKYYRIQIVRPNFATVEKLVADSVVKKNKLNLKLSTGDYTWRVRPENDGSVGKYTEERTLSIQK